MEKLHQGILEKLQATALVNELVILDMECDVGLEEYIVEKAKIIKKAKNIYSPIEENVLMLEYPSPKSKDESVFEKFFDSVAVVAKNAAFEGCFAVDITEYADCLDDPHFDELMSYIKLNTQTVYCLVVHTKSAQVAERIYNYISQSGVFIMNSFEMPSAQKRADYTASLIRDFTDHIDHDARETLLTLYTQHDYGYDFAEYLSKMLRSKDYQGDRDALVSSIEQVKKINLFDPGDVSYGY